MSGETKEELLRIRDLVVEYDTDEDVVQAVNHVDLQLGKGETLGLVGETGAGKTTIAKAILRILPDPIARPLYGHVRHIRSFQYADDDLPWPQSAANA